MLLALTACSTMEFNTSGREIFRVNAHSSNEKVLSVEATKDFYFWGLSPDYAEFNLQDETIRLGVNDPSYVSVEQSYTFINILYTVITLGLYCPVTYKVTLLSNGDVK